MRTVTAVLAGVLVGVGVLAAGDAFASRPAAPACAVAYIDTRKAMSAHPRMKELDERIRSDQELLVDSCTKREAEIRKREQDVEARLSPGSPAWETEKRKILVEMAELKYDKETGTARLKRQSVLGIALVYQDVRQEAERIASERGFSGVLDYDSEPLRVEEQGRVMDIRELNALMATRTVVWGRGDCDLTQAVIEAVKPAKPEAPEPPK